MKFSIASKKSKRVLRYGLIGLSAVTCGIAAYYLALRFPCEKGRAALSVLGDVSAVLFGVFGVWLGLVYKPTMSTELRGLSGVALEKGARNICQNAKRFETIFRGMRASAIVLVFSMMVRTLHDPLEMLASSMGIRTRFVIKTVFFFFVLFSLCIQSFSVLMSISPMREAKRSFKKAKRDAEFTLGL